MCGLKIKSSRFEFLKKFQRTRTHRGRDTAAVLLLPDLIVLLSYLLKDSCEAKGDRHLMEGLLTSPAFYSALSESAHIVAYIQGTLTVKNLHLLGQLNHREA